MAGVLHKSGRTIKHHQSLKYLNYPPGNAFNLSFSPDYCYALTSGRYLLTDNAGVKELWADRQYRTRSEPFWWSCVTKKETPTNKRTLRSWIARRARIAFLESLKKRGYNGDGTRLDPNDGVEVLRGTLQLVAKQACLLMNAEDLIEETDSIVGVVLKTIPRDKVREDIKKFDNDRKNDRKNSPGLKVPRAAPFSKLAHYDTIAETKKTQPREKSRKWKHEGQWDFKPKYNESPPKETSQKGGFTISRWSSNNRR